MISELHAAALKVRDLQEVADRAEVHRDPRYLAALWAVGQARSDLEALKVRIRTEALLGSAR